MNGLSYLDHYTKGIFQPYVKQTHTAGDTALLHVFQPGGDFSDPAVDDLVIATALNSFRFEAIDHGAGTFSGVATPDDMFLVPPGVATRVILSDPNELRIIAIPFPMLSRMSDCARADDLECLCRGSFRNPWLRGLLDRLWDEAAQGNLHRRLYFDAALLMIARELFGRKNATSSQTSGGLAPWQLKRVREALEDRLGTDLSLADLATEVNLSEAHLSRAFKVSTGMPPWRWLANLRIERAKTLLGDPRLSLTDVAQIVGYAGQNTFGEAFKRATGITPGQYRREVRQ